MNDKKELKACPFCGSYEYEWKDHHSHCYLYLIQDNIESLKMKPLLQRHLVEVVESAWNTRSPAPVEADAVKKAEALLANPTFKTEIGCRQWAGKSIGCIKDLIKLCNQQAQEIEGLKKEKRGLGITLPTIKGD